MATKSNLSTAVEVFTGANGLSTGWRWATSVPSLAAGFAAAQFFKQDSLYKHQKDAAEIMQLERSNAALECKAKGPDALISEETTLTIPLPFTENIHLTYGENVTAKQELARLNATSFAAEHPFISNFNSIETGMQSVSMGILVGFVALHGLRDVARKYGFGQ